MVKGWRVPKDESNSARRLRITYRESCVMCQVPVVGRTIQLRVLNRFGSSIQGHEKVPCSRLMTGPTSAQKSFQFLHQICKVLTFNVFTKTVWSL